MCSVLNINFLLYIPEDIFFSGVTSHYVIDQSMINIWDMKKKLGGEAKHIILQILHRFICKLIIWYISIEDKYSNSIHLWTLLSLYQISILFIKLWDSIILNRKIKFKISIQIEVKSWGFLLVSPPSILKCQDVQTKNLLCYLFSIIKKLYIYRACV